MRNRMNSSRLSMVMAVAFSVLVMTWGAPAAQAAEQLTVKNVSVSGAIVLVTVKNVSLLPAVSNVAVEAVVNGSSVWSFVPVVLLPAQSTTVSAAFTAAVSSVRTVGFRCSLTDDSTPL